jgi:hypothetical protein
LSYPDLLPTDINDLFRWQWTVRRYLSFARWWTWF